MYTSCNSVLRTEINCFRTIPSRTVSPLPIKERLFRMVLIKESCFEWSESFRHGLCDNEFFFIKKKKLFEDSQLEMSIFVSKYDEKMHISLGVMINEKYFLGLCAVLLPFTRFLCWLFIEVLYFIRSGV